MTQPLARLAVAATIVCAIALATAHSARQLPPPQAIPSPGPSSDQAYAPQAILPGGVVLALYPPRSPLLKMDRLKEPEVYNMAKGVAGRIQSIVNLAVVAASASSTPSRVTRSAIIVSSSREIRSLDDLALSTVIPVRSTGSAVRHRPFGIGGNSGRDNHGCQAESA